MNFQKGKINLESSTKTEGIRVTFLWEVSEGLWGVAYILCHTGHKLYTVFGIKYTLFIPYSQRVNSSPEEVFYFLFVYLLINLFILKFICSTVLNKTLFFLVCALTREHSVQEHLSGPSLAPLIFIHADMWSGPEFCTQAKKNGTQYCMLCACQRERVPVTLMNRGVHLLCCDSL